MSMKAATRLIKASHLDALDRGILASVIRQPDAPYTTWATENAVSSRTAARRFAAMRNRGIVRIIGRTRPDFGDHMAWIVRIHGSPARLQPIAVDLSRNAATRWVRHSMDRGELVCGITSELAVYDELLLQIYSSAPARDIRVHQLVQVWGHHGAVATGADMLDDIDMLLMDHYARDGRITAAQLAQVMPLNAATISRRRRRLMETGILYFEAEVHPGSLTEFGDFNVWLQVDPGYIHSLGEYLHALPETRFVAATSGTSQLFVNAFLGSAVDIVAWVDRLDGRGIRASDIVPMGEALKLSAV